MQYYNGKALFTFLIWQMLLSGEIWEIQIDTSEQMMVKGVF